MSHKAMWNNKNVRTCAGNDFSCGTMSGSGIPSGMVQYHSCRIIRGNFATFPKTSRFLNPEEYGKLMTYDEAEQLDRLHGRTHPYCRNSCNFVQSRAARKRGIVSQDYFYNRRVEEYRKKLSQAIANGRQID